MIAGKSFSGLARSIRISRKTVTSDIYKRSREITPPLLDEKQQCYEMDELQTYIGKNIPENYVYVGYAINRTTKKPVSFVIGRRTGEILKKVTDRVLKLNPQKIYTDGLNIYQNLIPGHIHKISRYMTVNIERHHLTIRTNIKPLQRKTICYSKKLSTLIALITIYLWDKN